MSNTLVIKHMPHEFTEAEKEDFLRHFGARDVRILSSKGKKYSLSFATFASNIEAEIALKKLHQLEVKGVKLCVEFAKDRLPNPPQPDVTNLESGKNSHLSEFIKALNAFNSSVNFMQPPPPHLKYKYPAPNKATLSNIMHALATNTKFYTQVCHLMNRMSIPPPFSTVPDYLVEQSLVLQTPFLPLPTARWEESSEEESEIESDPDEHKSKTETVPLPKKTKTKSAVKRPKLIKTQDYAPKSKQIKLATEDVFEKIDISNKKIELKVSSELPLGTDSGIQENPAEIGGFGKMTAVNPPPPGIEHETPPDENETKELPMDYISLKQLSDNRLSPSNYSTLPAFKNYNAGPPSCRLYIKNLAKSVTVQDLNFIYHRYLIPDYKSTEETLLIYDVKLMQEGRMKGQAFVTLQNENQAKLAVRETNGYILKDKPMVVSFARSAVAK